MRLLWSLPKAAPALLRLLGAYVDLASLDLARAQREIAAELLATAIIVVGVPETLGARPSISKDAQFADKNHAKDLDLTPTT